MSQKRSFVRQSNDGGHAGEPGPVPSGPVPHPQLRTRTRAVAGPQTQPCHGRTSRPPAVAVTVVGVTGVRLGRCGGPGGPGGPGEDHTAPTRKEDAPNRHVAAADRTGVGVAARRDLRRDVVGTLLGDEVAGRRMAVGIAAFDDVGGNPRRRPARVLAELDEGVV